MKKDLIIKQTKVWIEHVVVGLDLCPFARSVFVGARIRYVVSAASKESDVLMELEKEINFLNEDQIIETTLIIIPELFHDFLAYNDFLDDVDICIRGLNYEGVFQVASFHPHYQFSNTAPEDIKNYTNRSPYPILHILREASVEKAIDSYGDTTQIPVRNNKKLRAIGIEHLRALFSRT